MELKEIVVKHGVALATELVEAIAIPALEEAVKKTSTPIDDIAVAALKEPLKASLLGALAKLG